MAPEFSRGWYVDPSDSTRGRYWDGTRWTKDTWTLAEAGEFVNKGQAPPTSMNFDLSLSDPEPEIEFGRHAARVPWRWWAIALASAGAVTVVAAGVWVGLRYFG